MLVVVFIMMCMDVVLQVLMLVMIFIHECKMMMKMECVQVGGVWL